MRIESLSVSRVPGIRRALIVFYLALGVWLVLPATSCDRSTRPDVKVSQRDQGRAGELTNVDSGQRPAYLPDAHTAKLIREKDCDVSPTQFLKPGVTQPLIRYLWQDCNGNGVEDLSGDTYTADYGDNGTIDRRVLYREGETTIEYYRDDAENPLIFLWYISDDKWHLTDFSYSQVYDQWESEHHSGFFTLQKLCHQNNQWYPYSESPFCFYDTDNDGVSEVALRFSTVYDPEQDANDYSVVWSKLEDRPRPRLSGFRLSFDLENDAILADPYSYTMSFTVELLDPLDETPYLRAHKTQYGRRLNFIPKETALRIAHDILTNSIHVRKRVGLTYELVSSKRWEGVIWFQDGVHNIRNAGGPATPANRLQDFVDCLTTEVTPYFSEYDGLVHLWRADYSVLRTRGGSTLYTDADGDGYAEKLETLGGVTYVDPGKFSKLGVDDIFARCGITWDVRRNEPTELSPTEESSP